jgi:hypothetical protein
LLRRYAPRNDDQSRHETPFSRRAAPELCQENLRALKSEGAGNAGCALHRRSRVQKKEKRTRAYRAAEAIRHSLRNGFTAYFALSPEYRAFLPPSPPGRWHLGPVGLSAPPKDLTPTSEASGPRDLTVRSNAVRLRAVRSLTGPAQSITALPPPARPTPPRPPHPCPTFRDDHDTPL